MRLPGQNTERSLGKKLSDRKFGDLSGGQQQARNGKEAVDAVLAHKPDVLITDIEMPLMTGLDTAAELKRRRVSTRVIILTTFARAGYLRRAMEAGALGYMLKDMRAGELAEAVRRVQQGLRVIHPDLATEAWS
jgi:two-component system, NarL family, response regulator DesR